MELSTLSYLKYTWCFDLDQTACEVLENYIHLLDKIQRVEVFIPKRELSISILQL